MITTAIILAAGLGSRLNKQTELMPKSFLEVGGKRLIDMSLDKLIANGINRIYIGTGHCAASFHELARSRPEISLIHSPLYETTSSMYTLYNMRDIVKEPFLLLESDLLYDEIALELLLEAEEENLVLGSDITPYGDEVYLETNPEGVLTAISKNRDSLGRVESILVGISKVSLNAYLALCDEFEKVLSSEPKIDYEIVMARVRYKTPFQVLIAPGLTWCEVDDEDDLIRARTDVFSKLQRQFHKDEIA